VLVKLQWGHRFTSVETPRYKVLQPVHIQLQWGHRFTSVETLENAVRLPSQTFRLQWGHRFTSVETTWITIQKITTYGFNGATDLHRWKQCSVIISDGTVVEASMGPPIYIGGNSKKIQNAITPKAASMGPPIYIGGNIWRWHPRLARCARFNGATDLHRWKLC